MLPLHRFPREQVIQRQLARPEGEHEQRRQQEEERVAAMMAAYAKALPFRAAERN